MSKRLIDLGDTAHCAEMRNPFHVVFSLDEERLAAMARANEIVIASLP